MRTAALIVTTSLLSGCVIGGNKWQRPRDLPSSTIVDRTRVLGIRLDPPEANPGDVVTASALLPDPDGTAEVRLWTACPPEEATSFGCVALDEEAVIGFEPGPAPPTLVVPDDALDAATDEDKRNGIYWSVTVLAAPAELLADGTEFEDIDFNEVESAYKRLVVSNNEVKNSNPDPSGFKVDGTLLGDEEVMEVEAAAAYDLELVFDESSVETYTYVNRDGDSEERVEEPYGTWFNTDGEFFNTFTLHPTWTTEWTAPDDPGAEGSIYVVLRDRRGGMGWYEQPYRVLE